DQRVDLDRVAFDCQIAMLDLPAVFGTDLGTIPADIPYLAADPERAAEWRQRLDPGRFRLGLVHAGSPSHGNDKNRSLRLEMLRPLWDRADVAAYLLHKDTPEVSFEGLEPLGPSFGDFADTAAALQALDLLVSVDTSVAHLAGALGRPVWTLIPFVPDWRWLPGREDTPWYPQMRLFRQTAPGGWDAVLARVAAELDAVLRGDSARLRP
ncbi:MAG: glycosyltransferase family 9 protein, partial [Alphaproteobacteria bacterium]